MESKCWARLKSVLISAQAANRIHSNGEFLFKFTHHSRSHTSVFTNNFFRLSFLANFLSGSITRIDNTLNFLIRRQLRSPFRRPAYFLHISITGWGILQRVIPSQPRNRAGNPQWNRYHPFTHGAGNHFVLSCYDQISNSDERARIFTLCIHFLTYSLFSPSCYSWGRFFCLFSQVDSWHAIDCNRILKY